MSRKVTPWLLQVLHQVEHLGLHRDVERADRLVGHDQLRPGDQRAGDGNALALAAGKLVRVFVQIAVAQAHLGQHLGGALARCAAVLGSSARGSATMRAMVWRGSSDP
jgi:hypothetical protein